MTHIKYIFFLLIAIIGNPIYQAVSFLVCGTLGFKTTVETNVSQANIFAFMMVLILIFIVRLFIYSLIFCSKKFPFSIKGNDSFLYIFSERHLPQILGLFSFWIWVSPLEGNIIGFMAFPLTLFLGLGVSIATFIRILKIKKILIENISQGVVK